VNNDTDKNLCDALRNFVNGNKANDDVWKVIDSVEYKDMLTETVSDSVTYYMRYDFDLSSFIDDCAVEQHVNSYCENNAEDIIQSYVDDNMGDKVEDAVQSRIDGAIDDFISNNPHVLTEYFKTNDGKIALADALFDLFTKVQNATV